jgi:tetratricopeptide (TPR) repeat protein
LAALAHFFTQRWEEPAAGLTEDDKAVVLSWVGYRLRALGRLADAEQPMRVSLEMSVQQKDWKNAAKGAGNLSELSASLGDLAQACKYGWQAVSYADQSKGSADWFERMGSRTVLAEALLHCGELPDALKLFQEAEQLQQEYRPEFPRLYSVPGFLYCDSLLENGEAEAVLERADQTLVWAIEQGASRLQVALNQLSLALAHAQLALQRPSPAFGAESSHARQASEYFDLAVADLRESGYQNELPRALLARAAFFRATQDFDQAHKDLDEAKELAESGPMRLHLCDYHLESARLALAENRPDDARAHRREAAQLIESTGYNRRLPELQALPK